MFAGLPGQYPVRDTRGGEELSKRGDTCAMVSEYVQHNFPVGTKIFLGEPSPPPGCGPVDFYTSQKTNVFLCTLCAFSILV